MANRFIDIEIGYELWSKGYRVNPQYITEADIFKMVDLLTDNDGDPKVVFDGVFMQMLANKPEWLINEADEDERYRKENESKIRAYYAEHIEGKSFDEIDPNCWDFYSDWHKDVFGYRPHGIVCGEYINPHTVKCKHCGTELAEGINHSEESYEADLCDDCMEYYYGYCDKCGELFEYYPEMLEHSDKYGNVLCKKCLAEE